MQLNVEEDGEKSMTTMFKSSIKSLTENGISLQTQYLPLFRPSFKDALN